MIQLLIRSSLAMGLASLLTQVIAALAINASHSDDLLVNLTGPVQLVAEQIANTPLLARQDRAEQLAASFGYPVAFQDLTVQGPPRTVTRGEQTWIVTPLPDASADLVLGPLKQDPWSKRYLPTLALLPPLLSMLAGLLICIPLLRSIRQLETVAVTMREGNLQVRTTPRPGEAHARLGAALNGLADRIDQLLSDQRDLMRTVAHEIRAPISRMRFRVEMLEQICAPEHQRHCTGLINDLAQIDKLFAELISYVAFDEFDYERPAWTTDTFPIGEAVHCVVNEIADVPAERTITVLGDAQALVVANRKLFERAVTNLLLNAVAYSDAEVRVVLREHRTAVIVDVQDDGPGIPEADRPRVIKPFVRLARQGRRPRGTGLGLAIVQRIMSLHKGELHIVDAPGAGASCQLIWARETNRSRFK